MTAITTSEFPTNATKVINIEDEAVPQGASIRKIIIKGPFKYLNDRFPYPFYIPQLVKSPPFYIPEA